MDTGKGAFREYDLHPHGRRASSLKSAIDREWEYDVTVAKPPTYMTTQDSAYRSPGDLSVVDTPPSRASRSITRSGY
ncbi:MAG: hypothetical protein ACQETB_13050 [Halobacteriota archaeon]